MLPTPRPKYVVQEDTQVIRDIEHFVPESWVQVFLTRRGITRDEQYVFCNPSYEALSDPFECIGMHQAVERIHKALTANEKVTIYGDYDADGVCATTVAVDFFRAVGYRNYDTYLPHRHTEGYGFHKAAIDEIKAGGTGLIITVDVGIVAHAEIEYARTLGIDVVVTDHHTPLESVPDAHAVVHPKLGTYPDPMICGTGVAFQLVRGMVRYLAEHPIEGVKQPALGWEKWLLDLVAIATVSDMVPLLRENRLFVHYGLMVLRKTRRKGLLALVQQSGLRLPVLSVEDISFSLTPRINAASRMDHPTRALELLMADDDQEAKALAQFLIQKNDDRKHEVAAIMRVVHTRIEERGLAPIIVIGDPDWNHGVLGLVAGKITETYGVSAFVWSRTHDGIIKGSCRSAMGIDSMLLMNELPQDTYIQYGGHAGAGGFSLYQKNLFDLESLLNTVYEKHYGESTQRSRVHEIPIDVRIEDMSVLSKLFPMLDTLGPFGFEYRPPVCALRTRIIRGESFGKGQHCVYVCEQKERAPFRALAFFTHLDGFAHVPQEGETVYVIGTLEKSYFRGSVENRMRLLEIVPLDYFSTRTTDASLQ